MSYEWGKKRDLLRLTVASRDLKSGLYRLFGCPSFCFHIPRFRNIWLQNSVPEGGWSARKRRKVQISKLAKTATSVLTAGQETGKSGGKQEGFDWVAVGSRARLKYGILSALLYDQAAATSTASIKPLRIRYSLL